MGAVKSGSLQETVQLEQRLQDEILSAAVDVLSTEKDQSSRLEDLQQIDNLVKRDKRAVEALTSILGSSSGNKVIIFYYLMKAFLVYTEIISLLLSDYFSL